MRSYCLIAPAKINLYLEIIGNRPATDPESDRPGKFHELVMILQSIELADYIELHPGKSEDITLYCNHPQVPKDETNLAYRAARLMCDMFPDIHANYGGVDLKIQKNIPVAAGLAGGSTNAAAVLVGMNMMWQLGLTQPELQELGAKLGSDIPFCISGGTAIATGRGEKLDPIQDLDNLWVVLAKYNNFGVSTPWAYQTYRQQYSASYICDPAGIKSRAAEVRSSPIVSAIVKQDGRAIGKLLYNDLEKVVLPEYPQVKELRSAFAATDTLGTMMSGSGPTVFALCESEKHAIATEQEVKSKINDPQLNFWITKLATNGIHLKT
jgi:4-diphosphocytidyl-2-C-methyl-D-erythritol kinase